MFLLEAAADKVRELSRPLGLFQGERESQLEGLEEGLMELLLDIRSDLREEEHWELADKIRSELKSMGVEIKDQEGGTNWSVRS